MDDPQILDPREPSSGTPIGPPADAVQIRFAMPGGMPLLVANVGETGRGPHLRATLEEHGLAPLDRFIGASLPRGARVGFVIDGAELRLVDERDDALLRAPRDGIDQGWLDAVRRLKGTLTVVVRGLDLEPDTPLAELARDVDGCARDGRAIGAIVGFAEERPTLPLMF